MKAMLTDDQSRQACAMGEMTPLYQKLASLMNQFQNCKAAGNDLWEERCSDSIENIMERAPSGSGFDSGTKLLGFGEKEHYGYNGSKLQFETSFHHMDENGYYDGWSYHTVTVKPDLQFGYSITISGRDRNGIKEYIHSVFSIWLSERVPRFDTYPEVPKNETDLD